MSTLAALMAIAQAQQAPLRVRLKGWRWDAVMREVVQDLRRQASDGELGWGQRMGLKSAWASGTYVLAVHSDRQSYPVTLIRVGPRVRP